MVHQENDNAFLLDGENFTPPARTPWGGTRIRDLKGLGAGPIVGESWELSVEPSFVSRLTDGRPLDAVIAAAPQHWLGLEASSGGTALLMKLLDADDELSVQIHPSDGDPTLDSGEGGKPECWYVVARAEGSGLYLGLTEEADEVAMRAALDTDGDVSALLSFVPVEPGDFFTIEAGTPHCIGAGVFVVEPQRVAPARRGITYRYWDWGRRYDREGRRDPSGEPRELHRDRALAVTRWELARGAALLERVRRRAGPPPEAATVEILGEGDLRVARVAGSGSVRLPDWGTLGGLTVLAGQARFEGLEIPAGRTAAIAASAPREIELFAAHAIFAGARP